MVNIAVDMDVFFCGSVVALDLAIALVLVLVLDMYLHMDTYLAPYLSLALDIFMLWLCLRLWL